MADEVILKNGIRTYHDVSVDGRKFIRVAPYVGNFEPCGILFDASQLAELITSFEAELEWLKSPDLVDKSQVN